MEWVLIIYIYAGIWAKGDSVAIATIPMASQDVCEQAAVKSETLTKATAKEFRHVCVKVK